MNPHTKDEPPTKPSSKRLHKTPVILKPRSRSRHGDDKHYIDEIVDNMVADRVDRKLRTHRILYLFCGPRREGDIDSLAEQFDAEVHGYDLERSAEHDLLDDVTFQVIVDNIKKGYYTAGFASPPCSTFSPVRGIGIANADNKPRPLRGATVQDIYGFGYLSPGEKEQVRAGTACALRALTMAKLLNEAGLPFIVETAARRPGQPNVFKLPEYKDFLEHAPAFIEEFIQCPFGAKSVKPTAFLYGNVKLPRMPKRCSHPRQWWRIPWSGKRIWAAHPPLIGTQRAIPEAQWTPKMRRSKQPWGRYLSREAALYTKSFNEMILSILTTCINPRGEKRKREDGKDQPSKLDHLHGIKPLGFTSKLKGDATVNKRKTVSHAGTAGGMRNTTRSMAAVPGHFLVGDALAPLIEDALENWPGFHQNIIKALEHKDYNKEELESQVHDLRKVIAIALGSKDVERDVEKARNSQCSSEVRARFLELWARAANDPAAKICEWFHLGAPGGVLKGTEVLDGLWPKAQEDG